MRSSITGGAIAIIAIIVLILGYQSLFEVQQGMQALVIRFGQPVKIITEPCKGDPPDASPAQSRCAGLYAKWPLWIENVVYISARILDLEEIRSQEVIASWIRSGWWLDAFASLPHSGAAEILPDSRLDRGRQYAAFNLA